MIIHSYLAFTAGEGTISQLAQQLQAMEGCEVYPAEDDANVVVLVTEAENQQAQQDLEKRLESIAGLGCLAMVGGWTE